MNEPSTSQNQDLEGVNALRQRMLELEQLNLQYQQQAHQLQQQLAHERTARQRAEDQLQLVLASAQIITWDMDLTTNYVVCSANARLVWGIQEGTGGEFLASIHPDDRPEVIQAMEWAIADVQTYVQTYRVIKPNGAIVWLLSHGKICLNDQGQGIRMLGTSLDVTTWKQTEVALRQSEDRLRLANRRFELAAKAVNCLIYEWHVDSDWVERTDGLERLLGYSLAEAEPNSQWWRDRIHPDDLKTILEQANPALAKGDSFSAEYRVRNKVNEYIYVLDQCLVVARDAQGNPTQIVGSTTDISERKRIEQERKDAELQLFESQRFVQQIADAMPGTLYIYDLIEQRNVYVNRQIAELLGYSPEEIHHFGDRLFPELIHPDDLASIEAHIERLSRVQDGEAVDYEYRMRHANGEWLWLWSRNTISTRTPDGLAHQVVGTVHDITDRKRAESALAGSNQTLQAIVQACPLAIMGFRADGTVQLWNPAAERIFGWTASEVLNRLPPTIPDGKQDEFLGHLATTLKGQGLVGTETQRRTKRNEYLDVQIWTAAVQETQAGISCLAVIADISDRKRTEEKRRQAELSLIQSEERYRYLAESIPQLVWTANAEGGLIDVNHRWSDFTGLTLEQARTLGWRAVVHPDDIPVLTESWLAAQQDGTYYQAEGRVRRADGIYRWHLHQAVPLKNGQNQVIKWFGTATDIEDQKQLEQQQIFLLQQEQAAREQAEAANRVKDEFLAVLSHELRTPLNPILGWVRLLRTRKFDPQATDRALETIERNTKLQAQLIEDLLDVSRILQGKLSLNVGSVDLVTTIEAALETVRLSADAKGIQIQVWLADDLGLVNGDANRLQQVVWNLLSNAVKFTPPGGQVVVRLQRCGGYVVIQVQDTGQGISPDFLPYVFEYFRQADSSTTRQFGGLGLGLAIVRHLVELHGGTVNVESPGPGLGSTFTVELPMMVLVDAPTAERVPLQTSKPLKGLRILVVDDEADMRDLMGFILEEQGAAVSMASSAAEALKHLAEFRPDVLISDIGMPDMDGYMLIREVRMRSPAQGGAVPAIALTAFAGELNQQQALAAGFQLHVSKPLEPEHLVSKIASLVAR